jgi:predicted transcriptional regulator
LGDKEYEFFEIVDYLVRHYRKERKFITKSELIKGYNLTINEVNSYVLSLVDLGEAEVRGGSNNEWEVRLTPKGYKRWEK